MLRRAKGRIEHTPMPGYSHRSLRDKLGLKPGARVLLLNAPPGYVECELGGLPDGASLLARVVAPLDFVQLFVLRRRDLARRFAPLARALAPGGMLWVSWPKKASKVATDVDEGVVRELGLAAGLVDVKVAAVTELWSGLKFVRRKNDPARLSS